MGPTNVALVKLFHADQKLREAQRRLEAATRDVRLRERRTRQLSDDLSRLQQQLKEHQGKYADLDLDLKSRESHIEKLRQQQQTAHTNKEYQTFLIEINTQKIDKAKIEEDALRVMEQLEKSQTELKELNAQLESEQAQLEQIRNQIDDKIKVLEAEILTLRQPYDEAKQHVPARGLEAFERMADRFDGEALSALAKPNPREEKYICTACNISLVVDVYNRLHVRDEVVFCPSCHRILYIPEELTPERAVHKPKEQKATRPRKSAAKGAKAPRQQSAMDVMNSIETEPEGEQTNSTENEEQPAEHAGQSASGEGNASSTGQTD